MENENDSLVLTPQEAMKLLRCSKGVIYSGIKNGSIPSIHLGPRKIVIPRAKLMALLGGADDGAHPQG